MNKPGNISPRPTPEQITQEIDRIESGRELRKSIFDTIRNLIFIAAIAVLLSNLLISVLTVNRSSMSPTMSDGEIVIVVRGMDVKHGDIIAFHYNNKILLKRVIAKAGDWVHIDENGIVSINSVILDEPYLAEKSLGECDIQFPYQVPDGTVFVMGDHRSTSVDSRLKSIGPVSHDNIVGKVLLRIWPLPKFGIPK